MWVHYVEYEVLHRLNKLKAIPPFKIDGYNKFDLQCILTNYSRGRVKQYYWRNPNFRTGTVVVISYHSEPYVTMILEGFNSRI